MYCSDMSDPPMAASSKVSVASEATVEPGCQAHKLMGKRAASWVLHIQGRLQQLTTPINFMTSRTLSARERMAQHG